MWTFRRKKVLELYNEWHDKWLLHQAELMFTPRPPYAESEIRCIGGTVIKSNNGGVKPKDRTMVILKYGLIEAKNGKDWMARTFLNGVEVTHDCTAANDIEGWVDVLERDKDGNVVSLETHRKHGDVLIAFEDNAD